MPQAQHALVMPDLGMPGVTVVASGWLVEPGSHVVEGDRLLEVLAGCVTVDLPAPASGVLAEQLVYEDDELHVGQVLAIVKAADQEHPA
ncbi:MAG TPA: biotin/lipoyl-containing protein [Pirellulales bacterium]|nr:biotin/lipoyl-containing protein [Pirellulales bacterium]